MSSSAYYDEIDIEDFEYDEENDLYTYPCPCGDMFSITTVPAELRAGEDTVRCPSCSLLLRVIYYPEDFEEEEELAHCTASLSKVEIVC